MLLLKRHTVTAQLTGVSFTWRHMVTTQLAGVSFTWRHTSYGDCSASWRLFHMTTTFRLHWWLPYCCKLSASGLFNHPTIAILLSRLPHASWASPASLTAKSFQGGKLLLCVRWKDYRHKLIYIFCLSFAHSYYSYACDRFVVAIKLSRTLHKFHVLTS